MRHCDKNIEKALELADKLVALADTGVADSEDDGCRLLYAQMVDSAYRIKQVAEAEREKHIKKGL